MSGHLPNFLYIGTDKAGSTWLHEMLTQHPAVFMTPAKDLYYFDRYYERGIDWYRSQFRHSQDHHAVIGEVCQDYLYGSECADRIRRDLGRVRLMVTLRDPVSRAHSSYLYLRRQGQESGTFRQALGSRKELIDRGRYASYLRSYLEVFPRDHIFVGDFGDLQADPLRYLSRLFGWLDLDKVGLSGWNTAPRLPASVARSPTAARVARWSAGWLRDHDQAQLVGHVKRSSTVQRLLYRHLGDRHPVPSPEDVLTVRRALQHEVEAVSELVEIDLARRWGWTQ